MKIRTAIVAFVLLAGGAATTFAGERRDVDVRDHGDRDHREVVVRHDDRDDVRHDRDFRHDPVVQYDPGCTIIRDR